MLSPDDIAGRDFRVARRGYDRDEVHAFLAGVAAHVAELEQRLAEAEAERAAAPEPAPAPTAPAAPTPDEASRAFAEIGEETQRILEAAREAARGIARKAEADADRVMVDARRSADQVVAEGAQRREEVERVIAELEQSRAEIAADLRATQRTIEQTLRDLLPRARASSTVRQALTGEARRQGSRAPASHGAAAEAAPRPDAPPRAEAGADTPTGGAPAPQDVGFPDVGSPDAGSHGAAPAQAADGGDGAESSAGPPDPPLAARPEEPSPPAPAGGAVSDDDDTDPGPPPLAPSAGAPASGPVPVAGGPPRPSGAPPMIGPDAPRVRVVSGAKASPRTPRSGPGAGGASPTGAAAALGQAAAGTGSAAVAEDPHGLRTSALEALHRRTVRRVKRGLADLETATVDRIVRVGGQGEAEALLPLEEEIGHLAEPVTEQLGSAYAAGVTSASTLAGRSLPAPEESRDLGEALRSDAARRVRNGLLGPLRAGIEAGEDLDALGARARAVFDELRRGAADELAGAHLVHAYELGLLDTWAVGGVPARRWVLGREPRCPESRCRSNDRVGALAVGEPFPSGHDVPPIHVGCTCTTVPASATDATADAER